MKLLLCHDCGKGFPLPPTWGMLDDEKKCKFCESLNVSIVDTEWTRIFEGIGGDYPPKAADSGA